MKRPQYIILMSIDALRFDCVGYQEDKRFLKRYGITEYPDTPTFDKLAEESVKFTQAISVSSYTTSAHATIFTGMYPPKHGVRAVFRTKLSSKITPLAELFRKEGWVTIHSVDENKMFEPIGLNKGAEFCLSGEDSTLFELLEKYKNKNIYLFIHFFDVHAPYLFSPGSNDNKDYYNYIEKLTKKYNLTLGSSMDAYKIFEIVRKKLLEEKVHFEELFPYYLKGIEKFDKGRFSKFIENLKKLGILEKALLVVFSDHGETRYDYYIGHAGALYEEVIRIPLIFYYPEILPSTTIKTQISTADIMPTVLEMAGITSNKPRTQGRSLLPLIFGKNSEERIAYSEHWTTNKPQDEIDRWINECYEYYKKGEKLPQDAIPFMLSQRILRTPKLKFVVNGEDTKDFDPHKFLRLNDAEFVKMLYRKILSRMEDERGFQTYCNALQKGEITRKALIKIFLESDELKKNPKYAIFNLVDDPFEESPISVTPNNPLFRLFKRAKRIIDAICKDATPEEKIVFENQEEQKAVYEHLRTLGYI